MRLACSEPLAVRVFVQFYILAISFDFPMTCWETNKAEADWEIKQRVSGGRPAARIDRDVMTPGAECLYRARSLDMDPRWGVPTVWPSSLQNLVISSCHHLGKGEPSRRRSAISAPEEWMTSFSQSRSVWTGHEKEPQAEAMADLCVTAQG